ncbi:MULTISPECIES: HlyD family efflux transporter periplasmic adaptor subunit [unclassified Corallococcus]|uniref:HlyD family efflux transporter periplasmic adaptor subunit n=1 Tax=unclassified Corallococcus TaxID=2685029 RepID=UPI001A8E442B|nr:MULTISPECIES: HlyD family efflux transporter periplasmic adaptor subunit [unclassified Corallococcus]MBN9683456.1 HlyD family efflux transporter periplasmic adaptor subunit [Corallococcus sp. NCSPR001]WAS85026.1 HlyD family efflux transporter periplasmic adaptor subunit [Corallococcus sp. NCRR]
MTSRPSPYRKEALEYRERAHAESGGDLLRISPAWTRWAYWVLVGALACSLLFFCVGTLFEYAAGPALIRVEGKTDLTVAFSGVVLTVDVQPGQRVVAGEPLVHFASEQEQGTLARISREFELQLVRYLRDPSDEGARQALTGLRAERELAQARLEERTLRAPHAGVVGDLRLQPGQYIPSGTRALSLLGDDATVVVLGFLPGQYRPLLVPGMDLRLELQGFAYEYRDLVIESVGDQIIGPGEARRYLGSELGDAIPLEGALVLVRARLPLRTFVREGRTFNYYDGMPARAEARVKSESILLTLVPGLKELLPHGG